MSTRVDRDGFVYCARFMHGVYGRNDEKDETTATISWQREKESRSELLLPFTIPAEGVEPAQGTGYPNIAMPLG